MGLEYNIDCIFERGNVRSFALQQVRDQILPGPRQITDRNLPRENIYDNVGGEVNNQNLQGYYPAQNKMNIVSGRTGSYQSLVTNDQVFNPKGPGLDLNNQGAQGGLVLALLPLTLLPDPELNLILLIFLNP